MTLKVPETIQRILISSTSRFIAEYEAEGIFITHAWPGFRNDGAHVRLNEGPMSRSAYMVSFVTPELQKAAGVIIPNYENVGEWLCSLLSLLYGKRFDSHGSVQSNGMFSLPNLAQFTSLSIPNLPQNDHKERSDIAIPLDLRQIARIEPILMNKTNIEAASVVNAASKFYLQALQNAESNPEVAYLHLITAGEILANAHRPQHEDLLDENIKTILDHVRQSVPDGERAARVLANHMRQIKRRFKLAVQDLVDDHFFSKSTTAQHWFQFKSSDFADRVSAAYDIRSRYVHTGLSFGHWISPWRGMMEIQHGKPVVGDEKLAGLLAAAPTYIGLERAIRYCLLRFAEQHELFVSMPAPIA